MGDLVIIASMGTPNANNYELRSSVQFPSSSGATIPTVDGSATPQIFRSGYLTNRNVSDFTVTDTPSTTDDLWFTQNTNRTISTNASLTARFPPVAGNVTWALSGTLADALHASPPLIISSTNVPNPGTRGFLMDSSGVGIINAGILNVNDITIQGTISAANLDTGVTVQTRSGSLASLARNSPREVLRIQSSDPAEFDTDINYEIDVTVVAEREQGRLWLVEVLDPVALGIMDATTVSGMTYASSNFTSTINGVTATTRTIDYITITANSPGSSSSFTRSASGSFSTLANTYYLVVADRNLPTIGSGANATFTEIRRT